MKAVQNSCPVCASFDAKKERIIYADEEVVIAAPEEPCVSGHLIVLSRKHYGLFEEMSDAEAENLFFTTSYAASAIFELLGAQGTNIILNNGDFFDDSFHCRLHVIPRKVDDGLNFMWTPRQLPPHEMDTVAKQLESDFRLCASAEEEPEREEEHLEQEEEEDKPMSSSKKKVQSVVDYLVKHLKDRLP
ncbi:hypothetical protein COY95_03995 [Candidatus Woesearchaeota archaeon CG_4_10_14_0_8_um_filter_47_5]|nr:MAG: hypothetical protein COY95_03995 [Candidatus Woesearchaeota archaeon CG_4_10_14_0_8_um_filter_47_5]